MAQRFDEILDATNFPVDLRPLAKAIHTQESRAGKMDTRRANYAGAIGPMQVTKPTFEGLKKAGWIPASYQFENMDHATVAGLANIVALDRQFGGDPRKVAAAYYAGPKAIKASGEIRPFRDLKNPKAPNAQEYAEEVVGNISTDESGFSQFIAGKAASPSKKRQQDNLSRLMDELQEMEGADPPQVPVQQAQPAAEGGGMEPEPQAQATPPLERTLGQKLGRIGFEVVGGAGGAILGGGLAGPPGAIAGSAAGTMLGSKLASDTIDPLPPGEGSKEALIAGGMTVIGGVGGRLVSKLIKPRGLVEGGKELTEILAKKGITPVPSQVFDSKGINALENIGAASLFGTGSYAKARELAVKGVRETAEEYNARWLAALPQGQRMLDRVAQQADQMNVQVPMADVRNAADTMRKIFTNVDSAGRVVAEDIVRLTNANPTLPFAVSTQSAMARNAAATAQMQATGIASTPQLQGAQQIRSNLLDVIRSSSNQNEVTAARETVKVLDNALSKALAKADPAMHGAWRMGNAFYRAGKQGEEISSLFSRAIVPGGQTGEIGGKQLLSLLREHRLKRLHTELTPEQIERLNVFAKALLAAEGRGERAFEFVARGMQISAVIGTVGATATGAPEGVKEGALAVALAPVGLSMAFASPRTFRLLMATMQASGKPNVAWEVGSRLATQMAREGLITTPSLEAYTQTANDLGQPASEYLEEQQQ